MHRPVGPSPAVPSAQPPGDPSLAVREAQGVAAQLAAQANALAVSTPAEFEEAGKLLVTIKTRYKDIEDKRFEFTRPMDQARKRIIEFFHPVLDSLAGAETALKKKRVAWQAEADRKRREDEDRARQAALKEQERLQAAADKKAERLLERGHVEEAERILDTVPEVPMPVVPQTEVPKTKGVSSREYWYHRVVNPKLVPDDWKCIDEKKLAAFARATKGTIPVPGVEFYAEATEAVRTE